MLEGKESSPITLITLVSMSLHECHAYYLERSSSKRGGNSMAENNNYDCSLSSTNTQCVETTSRHHFKSNIIFVVRLQLLFLNMSLKMDAVTPPWVEIFNFFFKFNDLLIFHVRMSITSSKRDSRSKAIYTSNLLTALLPRGEMCREKMLSLATRDYHIFVIHRIHF